MSTPLRVTRPFPTLRRLGTVLTICSLAWVGTCAAAPDGAPVWYMHAGGLSYHLEPTRAEGRQWNQVHPGVGFESRRSLETGWSVHRAVGVMQDSRSVWGGYAGMGWLHRWNLGDAASLSAGAGAYALYRSVSWSGERALVPALLPTATLDLPRQGVGLNVVIVPPMKTFGAETVPAVMVQFVTRLR